MKVVETRPGKTYAVECVGEVVVTNTETGAIVAQGDGSGQVLFTACGSSYTLSDDDAKVVALFKLAPRLKLALLQGGAGGWLPKGYVELEYLQSSGSQYIDTGIATDGNYTISCRLQVSSGGAVWGRACTQPREDYTGGQSWARFLAPSESNKGLWFYYNYVGSVLSNNPSKPPMWDISKPHDWVAAEGGKTVMLDGESVKLWTQFNYAVNVKNPDKRTHYIFATNGVYEYGTGQAPMKLYRFTMLDGDRKTVFDGVPVLDADGVPCMFDRVSRKPFYNAVTGDFIAGLATIDDVRTLYLAPTGGSITLSVPAETPQGYIAALQRNNPNWTISIQYRES